MAAPGGEGRAQAADPAWSPDGSRIAFSSYRNDAHGIYTIPAPGR